MVAQTTKRTVKTWFQERIAGQTEVALPEITREAVAHFKGDAAFLSSLAEETVPGVLYQISAEVVGASRGSLIRVGDDIQTRDAFKQRARNASRFFDWLEHAGDRHVRLLDMGKGDLLDAAGERRKRAYTEVRFATLWETLAARMDDGQVVRDVFTPAEIEQIYDSLTEAREGEAVS